MCKDSNNSFSEIYTTKDLKDLIKFRIINGDVVIRGGYIKALDGIDKIEGSLGINDARLESLGNISEVTGDFWISFYSVFSRITSLENMKRIGGSAILRYSNINNLGALKVVEGKLSLRDTPIENLGLLSYVGGDLYLPERLKEKLDLNHITIKGKVRFWKDGRNNKSIEPKENIGLIRHPKGVTFWKNQYIYSVADIEKATIEQQHFYKIYKRNFKKRRFIDLEGNENYANIIFHDLSNEYSNNIKELQEHLHNLGTYYPNTLAHTKEAIIKKMESTNDYESAWELINKDEYVSIHTIIEYEKKLHRSLLNGKLIVALGGISNITNFGKSNIDKIKPFVYIRLKTYENEMGKSFFEIFIRKHKKHHTNKENNKFSLKYFSKFLKKSNPPKMKESFFAPEYYKHFFLNENEYDFYKKIDDDAPFQNNTSIMSHVVEKAILNQCRVITKEAEDLYRESIGMPLIGEGWISETELYYKISKSFPEHNVIQHGSPKWLGRQHLDIYFPELNIGIEYQGSQHYVPVEYFGGKNALKKTIERDEKKKKKCIENLCRLIYVNENYDFKDVKSNIEEVIKMISNGNFT